MEPVHLHIVASKEDRDIPFQPASLDIWDKKYRLKAKDGTPVDASLDGTYERVARALAEVEATPEARALWNKRFVWALKHGAIPAGPSCFAATQPVSSKLASFQPAVSLRPLFQPESVATRSGSP